MTLLEHGFLSTAYAVDISKEDYQIELVYIYLDI